MGPPCDRCTPVPTARDPASLRRLALIALVAVIGASGAVAVDAFGAGEAWQHEVLDRVDRFVAGPVPDRPSIVTVVVTPPPTASSTASASIDPGASPTVTPLPTPTRAPVDFRIDRDPEAVFAHEIRDTWCSPAGVQMTLAVLGLADTSEAFQRTLAGRVHEWESYDDSHNGGWGPAAMVEALAAYGAPGYVIHAYTTRDQALHDAAVAIETTEAPVLLLAWRGAHTWVMTGYRADADPAIFTGRRRQRHVHPGSLVPDRFPDLGAVGPAGHVPGRGRDGPELPALEATRGEVPGSGRALHRPHSDTRPRSLASRGPSRGDELGTAAPAPG